jgi:hypothetical protein
MFLRQKRSPDIIKRLGLDRGHPCLTFEQRGLNSIPRVTDNRLSICQYV